MTYLGYYYHFTEWNNDLVKKYYLNAITLGNSEAMTYLGWYYSNDNDYYLMKKYYLMAIALGNSNAMLYLGFYYQYTEKNYELMKKYNIMSIN